MVREWSLNLENMGGKKGLKDPLGFKQDLTGVIVRQSRDSTKQTQVEAYERVSLVNAYRSAIHTDNCSLSIESMGVREISSQPDSHVHLHHVDDG